MIKNLFNSLFYKKKVLITGHTGFKGSWLSIWLKELGAEVIGYALAPITTPNNFAAANLEQKIKSYIYDIRDLNKLNSIVRTQQPEIVFHLAAQPLVRFSYLEPKNTYETNIIGLVNLFEAIRQVDSVKVVVVITSDKCYHNNEWIWGYRETDRLGGFDPYSASKACGEIITESYRTAFFSQNDPSVLIATARAGNVIGGGDWSEDRLIPDCIKAIVKDEPILIRNPHAIRPWQHVLEPLSGYLWLAARLYEKGESFAEAWNFGPNQIEAFTVEQIVNHIAERWQGTYKIQPAQQFFHESNYLKLDCNKAYHRLNWHSILTTKEAIDITIDWYRKFYENKIDSYELCCQQISYYSEQARILGLKWANQDLGHANYSIEI